MTSLHHDFNDLAARKAPKYPPPFSLRLTFEERAQLERDAAGMALGAYIRSRLFGDDVPPRRTRGKFPVKDKAALAKVLAVLGASRLSQNINQLARAVNIGALPVTPETDAELRDACRAVMDMRDELLRALGKMPGGAP
ncbi:hypothetical protein A6J80_05945 [Paracoccus yeei]|uniref:Bacterial mobilisation domain-containing protein n=1 Tax=Paracoccus yeei TaxID=147645 RepID=A0A1V0GQ69_9RHOB|nr:hypothetical protein [Paracoccus yeei]ARC35985.1 hypothetical protein A6J80_05945 [Paracoccus yeei]